MTMRKTQKISYSDPTPKSHIPLTADPYFQIFNRKSEYPPYGDSVSQKLFRGRQSSHLTATPFVFFLYDAKLSIGSSFSHLRQIRISEMFFIISATLSL